MKAKPRKLNVLTGIMAMFGIVLLWGGMIVAFMYSPTVLMSGIVVAVIGVCLTAAALLIRERLFG